MHRLLKLKTPLLALVLSVAAEVLLFGVALLGRVVSSPDRPILAWQFFGWFHWFPDWLVMSCMRVFKPFHDIQSVQAQVAVLLMMIAVALLQWYVVFFIGISLFRRFKQKTA